MVAHVMRWAGMIGVVVCGLILVGLGSADWIDGESVTWAEPEAMILHTDALSPDAGAFVRFFMVSALPWSAVVAMTSITVGLRGPSTRLFAFLLPLFAGAALGGAASDNTGRRLLNIDDPRVVAVLHESTTVWAVVFGFLVLASIALLFRLHIVYSTMLVILYVALAAYHVAGAAALSEQFGAAGPVHVTGVPRTYAIISVLAAVCALVGTVGAALLPKLKSTKRLLVVRVTVGTWRTVREFAQSIAIGLTPSRDTPGYEPRPQFQVLLLCGLIGVLMSSGAIVLGFWVEHAPSAIPGLPTGFQGSPSPSRGQR